MRRASTAFLSSIARFISSVNPVASGADGSEIASNDWRSELSSSTACCALSVSVSWLESFMTRVLMKSIGGDYRVFNVQPQEKVLWEPVVNSDRTEDNSFILLKNRRWTSCAKNHSRF